MIALYFGSFNPIHHGHLIIADQVISRRLASQVWFVVSPQNPFKKASSLLNEYHRLHFVKMAIDGDSRFRAIDIEFNLPKPSYTSVTLNHLSKKYPSHQFSILMGSDSYANLERWKNIEYIRKHHNIFVYSRLDSSDINVEAPDVLLKAPYLDISSTDIRSRIKAGLSIRYYVPDAVAEEIELNNYYK